MKKLIAAALLLVSFVSVDAYAQLKIGFTNPAKILDQLPEVEEIEQEINALIIEKDEELASNAQNLQKIFSDYESSAGNLSEQERSVREQELMELNNQFEAERNKMLEEVRQKRNELMQPVIQKMNKAMAQVATEMQLDLILNEGTSTGDMIIFYANDDKLDVTTQIVEKIKQS